MNKKIVLLASLLLLTANCLISQQFFEFHGRPVTGSARTASLGGAAVGESYDVSSMYWNPAALSFLRRSSVIVSSIVGLNGQSFDNTMSIPPLYVDNYQVVAAGIAGSVYGEKWSQPFFAYNGVDLGYSIKIHPTLSVGVLMNLRYGSKSLLGLWSTTGAIGSFYSPASGISYGFVFDGIGSGVLYKYDGYFGTLKYRHKIDQSIRMGSSFRFPSLYRLPYITISMESQKFINRSGITYRGGFETYPFEFLSLRVGIISSTIATAGSYGCGVNFKNLLIDYAFFPNQRIERFHQISIAYQLGR